MMMELRLNRESNVLDEKIDDLIDLKKHIIRIVVKHGGCFDDIFEIHKLEKLLQTLRKERKMIEKGF